MERAIEVRHVSLEINADFGSFTQALERSLGRFDYSLYKDLETNPRSVEERLKAAAGEEGLMLFNVQEHGRLLNIVGSPRKAKQYVLGNPLIAVTMTRHDIRAALYAPSECWSTKPMTIRRESNLINLLPSSGSSIIRTLRPWRDLSIQN